MTTDEQLARGWFKEGVETFLKDKHAATFNTPDYYYASGYLRAKQEARIAALTKDAEPIYQWKAPYSGAWRDISKDVYLEIKGYIHNITGNGEVRVIYTHPPAPKAITAEDVTVKVLNNLYKYFDYLTRSEAKEMVADVVNAFNGVKP